MKLRVIDSTTHTVKKNNEDHFWHNEDTVMVLDGSTNLGLYGDQPDAHWFVRRFAEAFEANLPTADGIKSALRASIDTVAGKFRELTGIDPTTTNKTSSASLALVNMRDESVDCFLLGDCSVIVYFRDGSAPALLRPNTVDRFDAAVLSRMVALAQSRGVDVAQTIADPEVSAMLSENRSKMNTPDGYWILAFCKEALDHMLTRSFPAESVDRVVMFTDGFDMMTDELLRGVPHRSLDDMCAAVRAAEREDSSWNRYPRFCTHDDACAVLAQVRQD